MTSGRLRLWAPPVLVALAALLALANLHEYGYLNAGWLAGHKDAIQAGGILITSAVAVTTACLAYFRFFRGRVLATRADVVPSVSVIAGPDEFLLHSLSVDVKNVGTMSLLDPVVTVETYARRGGPDEDPERATLVASEPVPATTAKRYGVEVIDSGETAGYFVQHLFEHEIWAVTYKVVVESPGAGVWTSYLAVANRSA